MIVGIISFIVVVFGGIIAGVWTFYNLFNRAKKRYWDLYQQIGQVQQEVRQVQQEVRQVQQEVRQVQQHLLLEHLSDMAVRAKEMDFVNKDTYGKFIQLLHEMEMDNLQGKTLKSPE